MLHFIKILLTGIITDCYLFPLDLNLMGFATNTKMLMAAVGIALFAYDSRGNKMLVVPKEFLAVSLLAIAVSVLSYFTMVIHHTSDSSLVTYCISFWVWISAAYTLFRTIQQTHGEITVELIAKYMIAVATSQCILAYAMTLWPWLHAFIDSFQVDMANFLKDTPGRLYGLSCALDSAGLRFAAILIIITFLSFNLGENKTAGMIVYTVAFIIITIIGNMIARSTLIGIIWSVALSFIFIFRQGKNLHLNFAKLSALIGLLALVVGGVYILYHMSPSFRQSMRFGFEGFFSLAETGEWNVRSNDMLMNMVVWPETLSTWIFGDGYLNSPNADPNFLGPIIGGFYMGTDIGYLRYIFYFGLPGLLLMITIFMSIAYICIKKLDSRYTVLFFFLLLSNFTGWLKVSTDILVIFAPFFVLALEQDRMKPKLLQK